MVMYTKAQKMPSEVRRMINKKDKSHLSVIIDKKEIQKYKRKNKRYKRTYELFLHVNNLNFGTICAYYGNWTKGHLKKLYIKTGHDSEALKEDMYRHYENHIKILLGQIKIVKVCPKLIADGYAPVDEKGKTLSRFYWDECFMITDFYECEDGDEFDIMIKAKDGKEFVVCSHNFKRVYPVTFFMEE